MQESGNGYESSSSSKAATSVIMATPPRDATSSYAGGTIGLTVPKALRSLNCALFSNHFRHRRSEPGLKRPLIAFATARTSGVILAEVLSFQAPLSGVSLTTQKADYYRRDNRKGISPPILTKSVTPAQHIVRTRGKRTQFSSVSLDPDSVREFGNTLYRLKRDKLETDKHKLIEHTALIADLKRIAQSGVREDRALALHALRYALRRKEGLVEWAFKIDGIDRKRLANWTLQQVNQYFSRVS